MEVYPLVNVNKKLWKDPPFYSWVVFFYFNWAISLGNLLVYQRVLPFIVIGDYFIIQERGIPFLTNQDSME